MIRSALERGQRVRMTCTGLSMRPFIRDGDTVELEPPDSPVVVGDIVLVQSLSGYCVLHRVVRLAEGSFFLAGDAQEGRDGPFDRNALVGRAVRVFRRRRAIILDRGLWRLVGQIWLRCGPWKPALLSLAGRIRAAIRSRWRKWQSTAC